MLHYENKARFTFLIYNFLPTTFVACSPTLLRFTRTEFLKWEQKFWVSILRRRDGFFRSFFVGRRRRFGLADLIEQVERRYVPGIFMQYGGHKS